MKPDTPDMKVAAEALIKAQTERKVERVTARERHALMMQEELAAADRTVSRAMHRALAAGLSKSRIGRIMGTADWKTITTMLDLTAEEFEAKKITAALEPNFVRFVHEIDHDKGRMKVTLYVRGDGSEIRKTPREIRFTYRNAQTFADFNVYSAFVEEFDLSDNLALVRAIRNELQEAVPPGRAIRVIVRGLEDETPERVLPQQEEDPLQYMTAADWDAMRDE